jgi:hypothetical protein
MERAQIRARARILVERGEPLAAALAAFGVAPEEGKDDARWYYVQFDGTKDQALRSRLGDIAVGTAESTDFRALALVSEALCACGPKFYGNALDTAERCRTIAPGFAMGYFWCGVAQSLQLQFAAAAESFQAGVELAESQVGRQLVTAPKQSESEDREDGEPPRVVFRAQAGLATREQLALLRNAVVHARANIDAQKPLNVVTEENEGRTDDPIELSGRIKRFLASLPAAQRWSDNRWTFAMIAVAGSAEDNGTSRWTLCNALVFWMQGLLQARTVFYAQNFPRLEAFKAIRAALERHDMDEFHDLHRRTFGISSPEYTMDWLFEATAMGVFSGFACDPERVLDMPPGMPRLPDKGPFQMLSWILMAINAEGDATQLKTGKFGDVGKVFPRWNSERPAGQRLLLPQSFTPDVKRAPGECITIPVNSAIHEVLRRLEEENQGWGEEDGGLRAVVRFTIKGVHLLAYALALAGEEEMACALACWNANFAYSVDHYVAPELRLQPGDERGNTLLPAMTNAVFLQAIDLHFAARMAKRGMKSSQIDNVTGHVGAFPPEQEIDYAFRLIQNVRDQEASELAEDQKTPFVNMPLAKAYSHIALWAWNIGVISDMASPIEVCVFA